VFAVLLVTGGNGQLAWDLHQLAVDNAVNLVAYPREILDITNPDSINTVFEQCQPDVVINTAAYTAVDKAEQEIEQAFRINRDGAASIAEACVAANIPLVHLSTDYIFDGQKSTAYCEDDLPNPLSVYGKSKWEGEVAIRERCPQHIILRVSGVFGQHGHNFVKTILRLARERDSLRIVADQTTCPTPATDIAAAILSLVKQPLKFGTYHYCSSESMTWYQFAKTIIAMAGLKTEVQPITTADYPLPAKRPPYSALDTHKIQTHYGIQPQSSKPGLLEVIKNVPVPTA
jgi:dTDP-4-dehydrorhamnose reductase